MILLERFECISKLNKKTKIFKFLKISFMAFKMLNYVCCVKYIKCRYVLDLSNMIIYIKMDIK